MIIGVPSRCSDQLPDNEQQSSSILTYASQATFHWLADCLWPSRITDRERYLTDIVLRYSGKTGRFDAKREVAPQRLLSTRS
jgi:hypothetical protein